MSSSSALPSGGTDTVTHAFSGIYAEERWGLEARSGLGSREDTTRDFRPFLEAFLRDERVTSMVDAGCGHWPTGYQRFMQWQGVDYCGVDVVPYVIEENRQYFEAGQHLEEHGLSGARFQVGDVSQALPAADLLFVKDVLMHLPTAAIHRFLEQNIGTAVPRYRMVLVVQNEVPLNFRENIDIEPGQLLPFDISKPPFGAKFESIFRWRSDEPKVAQLWRVDR